MGLPLSKLEGEFGIQNRNKKEIFNRTNIKQQL